MTSHARSRPSPFRSVLPLVALSLVGALLCAGEAEAQVKANRLANDECLAADFTSFDDVVMTAAATHQSGSGDVYQAICDSDDCWGFSINRYAAVNILTTGLTSGEYTWYVCAWNGGVRRVVGNLLGGAAVFTPDRIREGTDGGVRMSLHDPRIPEDLRRFAARLRRVPDAHR